MNFFTDSIDKKVIGEADGGISQLLLNRSAVPPPSIEFVNPRKLKSIDLSKQAITPFSTFSSKTVLTDFCSAGEVSTRQKIVNTKVKLILNEFTNYDAYFFPVEIHHAGAKSLDYHLLHLEDNLHEKFIDFGETSYYLFDKNGVKIDEVIGKQNVPTEKEVISRVKHFVFKGALPDIFVTPFRLIYFISDELADRLISSNVSGIDIYKYSDDTEVDINLLLKTSQKISHI